MADGKSANFFFWNFVSLLNLISQNGEIDILEGVHDNEHNQIAWHTAPGKLSSLLFISISFPIWIPGCVLDPEVIMSGTVNVCTN